MRGVGPDSSGPARVRRSTLQTEAQARSEDSSEYGNVFRRGQLRENRKAEEMANGTAGTPNPYGRYLSRLNSLNEQPIR
jgi:hypothetical protein